MRAAIHQPQYFPYPGFFHKLSSADVFVIMDDVQYDKRFTNRNRILVPQGPMWLTVPIKKKDKFMPNMSVEINNEIEWRKDHYRKISISYANAPFYRLYDDYFESLFRREWSFLFDLDLETIKRTMEWLGINIPVIRESELNVKGEATERLLNVCRAVGADTYISGSGGKSYLVEGEFQKAGIKLEYQTYSPVAYKQRHISEFVPNLSIIDLLCNIGPNSISVVKEGDRANRGAEQVVASGYGPSAVVLPNRNPIEE